MPCGLGGNGGTAKQERGKPHLIQWGIGQPEAELTAFTGDAAHLDLDAQTIKDHFDDRQPNPNPSIGTG